MKLKSVKESWQKMEQTVSFRYPAIGWYFSKEQIGPAFAFKKDRWVCMFMYLKMVLNHRRRIRFSKDFKNACTGAAEYFGFQTLSGGDGEFIADTEQFKKSRELARAYYRSALNRIHAPKANFLYMETLDHIDPERDVEVVNLFPDPMGLAELTVLSNYDRRTNMDNVLAPFSSGCQSFFTIPYDQQFQKQPKGIIGLMDPLARNFVPADMISFSLPANRFVEMASHIKGSFLDRDHARSADR